MITGVFFCATAIIFIKASAIHPVLLASLRLVVATAFLLPLFLRDLKREPIPLLECFRASFWPGILLGLHFMTWLAAARMTSAANAALIVNLAPVAMPFMLYLLVKERVNRFEIFGTLLAMAGTAILFGADFHISKTYFMGDVICLISMLFFTLYLALGRRKRTYKSIWIYVTPIYATSSVFCFICSLFFTHPLHEPWSIREGLLLLGLGLIPTVLGHSILNWAMTHLRGQLVSIVNMGQFIFAGIMAYLFFSEVPASLFYPACALLISGAILAMRTGKKPAMAKS